MSKRLLFLAMAIFLSHYLHGQDHNEYKTYVKPDDIQVQQKLAQWQELKFGLFMHWGNYSQWGVVESWSICPEDEDWTQRKGPYANNYDDYKRAYENLQNTFNPTHFNPEKWVVAAKNAGMKYVVFTTKHHDGFSMFDTRQTDYKITDAKTPFSKNPRANITLEVFNAFRKEGFMIGAYFSKPDWHSADYWWPYFPPKDRNVNYDPEKYPQRWQKFKQFTFNQIGELMSGYGKVDLLWLDGGWVRPKNTIDSSVDWQRTIKYNQDIDMEKIATMARQLQPGLLMVDRSVGGKYENYTTPEQQVPAFPLDHPWESCITMGNSWSYVPGDHYKSARDIIELLIKIVSRGGNLLMNIGPGPDGDWDPVAYQRLDQIGAWIKINGEGIYNSVTAMPYSYKNIYFTKSKNSDVMYAFLIGDKDDVTLPEHLTIDTKVIQKVKKVTILGSQQHLRWKLIKNQLTVNIPQQLQSKNRLKYAVVFKIEY